ncbi:MAG: hypothetical protein P4K94_07090 [Terracidiphilus sp.]|nr:hypothetical protein [Terracidiphilus sp.]
MHIHGNSMGIQAASFYSAAQGEKTAAERAAEVRKRLLKHAAGMDTEDQSEETPSFGQWLDLQHTRLTSGEEYNNAASGKDSDFS